MPIPGVPVLEPVPLKKESPGEAGRPGKEIAGMGGLVQDIAAEGQGIEGHIREAQKHVDTLGAQNELNAAVTEFETNLQKTQNSRDIPDILQHGHETLNEIAKRWGKSPAAVTIQMDADSLRPGVEHLGQMRQIHLMGQEFKTSLDHQAEVLGQDYAGARGAGDAKGEQAALAGFTQAVVGGVKTGLIGDVEAQETIRLFRKGGQETQIKSAIANPDPNKNQEIFDQLNAHPEQFPDVTKEFIETAKEHAISAKETHIQHQDWVEGQMAEKTMLRPMVNMFTNPATGRFDESRALEDVDKKFASGQLSAIQRDVLSKGAKALASDQLIAIKKEDEKWQDDIVKLSVDGSFSQASAKLDQYRDWAEKNETSDHYRTLATFIDSKQKEELRERRIEAREARAETSAERTRIREEARAEKRENDESSQDLASQIGLDIVSGKVLEPIDIYGMKGLTHKDKLQLMQDNDKTGNLHNPFIMKTGTAIRELPLQTSDQNELFRVFMVQVKSGDLRGSQITQLGDELITRAKKRDGAEWINQTFSHLSSSGQMTPRERTILSRSGTSGPPAGFDVKVPGKDGKWYWGNRTTQEIGPEAK